MPHDTHESLMALALALARPRPVVPRRDSQLPPLPPPLVAAARKWESPRDAPPLVPRPPDALSPPRPRRLSMDLATNTPGASTTAHTPSPPSQRHTGRPRHPSVSVDSDSRATADFLLGSPTNSNAPAPPGTVETAQPTPPMTPAVSTTSHPPRPAPSAATTPEDDRLTHPMLMSRSAVLATDDDGNDTLNGYMLWQELGRGATGTVYLGVRHGDEQPVAIKAIHRRFVEAALCDRTGLLREVAIMKKLRHPHVVTLYECIDDPEAEAVYLVMQFVPDGPVAVIGPDGAAPPLSPATVLHYAQQLGSALRYLHGLGVVHGDIKPENILVDQAGPAPTAFFVDFGVSRSLLRNAAPPPTAAASPMPPHSHSPRLGSVTSLRSDAFLLSAHSSVSSVAPAFRGGGTPLFFAPELFHGGRPSPAADIWAFGATLYCLLFGRLPFWADSMHELCSLVTTAPLAFPAAAPAVQQWQPLLQQMLAKDPARRIGVRNVARALRSLAVSPSLGLGSRGSASTAQALSLRSRSHFSSSLPLGSLSARSHGSHGSRRLSPGLVVPPELLQPNHDDGGEVDSRPGPSDATRGSGPVSSASLPPSVRAQPRSPPTTYDEPALVALVLESDTSDEDDGPGDPWPHHASSSSSASRFVPPTAAECSAAIVRRRSVRFTPGLGFGPQVLTQQGEFLPPRSRLATPAASHTTLAVQGVA